MINVNYWWNNLPEVWLREYGGGEMWFCHYDFGEDDQLEEQVLYSLPWVLN